MDVLRLGRHLGDRNRRVGRREMPGQTGFSLTQAHALRVHAQRCGGDRVVGRAVATAGFIREAMCARTIDIYEELLFPEAQPMRASAEPLAIPA